MTKGTKIFRIVICVLLAFTMIWSGFLGVALLSDRFRESVIEEYGLWVTNVRVTSDNAEDILGDGTVHYDAYDNILTFENALIESENTIIYSVKDLNVRLIGENKFICKNESNNFGIYAGDSYIHKDLAIYGDGSLVIEMTTKSKAATGIFADDLMVNSDITIITPDCEYMTTGIVCDSSLIVVNKAFNQQRLFIAQAVIENQIVAHIIRIALIKIPLQCFSPRTQLYAETASSARSLFSL